MELVPNKGAVPHPALNVLDILRTIFEGIASSGRHTTKCTLFSAALCCKTFSDLALDSLWRDLSSITPLLKLFPGFVEIDGVMVLRGNINDPGPRLQQYAQRVQKLVYNAQEKYNDVEIHPSVYTRLAQLGKPLLPSLRHLECVIDTHLTLQVIPFLSPTLETISLEDDCGTYDDHHTVAVLDALGQESPNLLNLTLFLPTPIHTMVSISVLKQLRTLTLTFTDIKSSTIHDLFDGLSLLDHLVTLDITLPDSPMVPPQQSGLGTGFPSLESFTMKGRIPQFIQMFDMLMKDNLKSVIIHPIICNAEIESQQIMARWRELFEKLASRFSKSLCKLDVGSWNYNNIKPHSTSHEPSLMSVFESLLDIHELETLNCSNFPCFSLSNDDVAKMATAWPRLKVLRLPFSAGPIQPTFVALELLARHCCDLAFLSLTVNTRHLPRETSTLEVSHHGLQNLWVGLSYIDDPMLVARHLDRVFPSIKYIRGVGGYRDQWDQVEKTVRHICQPVRSDEKKRSCDHTYDIPSPLSGAIPTLGR